SLYFFLSFAHLYLHSFPTRRSSDLYLPLYIFCGEFLLCARLRKADIDGCAGTVDELIPIVNQIRQKWPKVKILLRADSGFCREEDRKSTRLNSSHVAISYAVFCLKK